ncbi:hypothetical protein B4U80_05541, partial [Leptotrombidium deliense]
AVCNDWYNEIENYEWNSFTAISTPNSTVGHFAQLVWKNTKRIGCATVISKGPKGGAFTVCVYHPPGNIESTINENVISTEECNEDAKENITAYEDLTNETWNGECLEIHNKLRKKHGVPPLVLDGKLIEFAKNRAIEMAKRDYANFGHKESVKFAENLHWGKRKSGPSIRCDEPVNLWYNEINNYDWKERINHNGTYAHFSQIIWNATEKLGCAQVLSKGIKGGTYTVCGYEPLGNMPSVDAHKNNVFDVVEKYDNVSSSHNNLTISKRSVSPDSEQNELNNDNDDIDDFESYDYENITHDDSDSTDEKLSDIIVSPVNNETVTTPSNTTIETVSTTVAAIDKSETQVSVVAQRKKKTKTGRKSSTKKELPTRQFKQSKRKRKTHVRLAVTVPTSTMSSTKKPSLKFSKFKFKPQTLKSSLKNVTRSFTNIMSKLLPKING